jgi:hypothetical protein
MRYSLTFDRVEVSAALAAGIIAAIVIGSLVCICAGVFLAWRARTKYFSPQQTVTIINPGSGVSAWGQSTSAPTVTQASQAPPAFFLPPPPPSKV